MPNTGNKIQPTLKKVTNDVNEFPLDINNNLCSVSGLPQALMPNPEYDPSYSVPSLECNPPLYYSDFMEDYYTIECETGFSNNIYYSVPNAYASSYESKEKANEEARRALDYYGQQLADSTAVCGETYCNTPETRIYYSEECDDLIPVPYPVTLAQGTFCGTSIDDVESDVNGWFAANAQNLANDYGTCSNGNQETTVWVVTGDPCTSERTATKVYYKSEDNKFYLDSSFTLLANFYFFPENNTLNSVKVMINGVVEETYIYAPCSAPTIYYKDMGTPADISISGNSLIACYPNQHVVVKYDISTGENPVGTIVAGQLNIVCKGPIDTLLLNTPMLVQWRSDGEMFAVYSSGPFKTIKIFLANGVYVTSTDFQNTPSDSEWEYDAPLDEGDYYTVPSSSTSLVGLLTAQTTDLSNFWLPVSMEFGTNSEFLEGPVNTVFLGLWNKSTGNANRYKIFAVCLYSYTSLSENSLTQEVHNDNGFSTDGNDLIRGIKVIKTSSVGLNSTNYKIAIATPYAIAKSNKNDKKRFYDIHILNINVARSPSFSTEPIISVASASAYYDSYRINSKTNGVWKNNVKAEIVLTSDTLIVLVKSTNDSLWNIIKRSAAATTAGLVVGGLALLTSSVAAGWLTNTAVIGILGFTPGGIIVGALIITAVILLSPPVQRYLGTSALVLSYTGTSLTGVVYHAGSYTCSTWITNSITRARTIYLDSGLTSSLSLYSMPSGRIIKKANWNANDATTQITI